MKTEIVCTKCGEQGKGVLDMNEHSKASKPMYYIKLPRKWVFIMHKIYCPSCDKKLKELMSDYGIT